MLEGAEIAEVAEQQEHEKNPITAEREMALEYIAGTEFQDGFIQALGNKEDPTKRALDLATLQRNYAAALFNISCEMSDPAELSQWNAKVNREIFDRNNPDSLANAVASRLNYDSGEAERQLIGATTVLTFMDLWQTAKERRMVNVKVLQADPSVDVRNKIDLIVETQDSEYLIQLKAGRKDGVKIQEVTDETTGYLDNKIPPEHVERMLAYAAKTRRYNERNGIQREVKVLAIELPGMHADCVNNVFGKINAKDKNRIFGSFREQGQKVGLIQNGQR